MRRELDGEFLFHSGFYKTYKYNKINNFWNLPDFGVISKIFWSSLSLRSISNCTCVPTLFDSVNVFVWVFLIAQYSKSNPVYGKLSRILVNAYEMVLPLLILILIMKFKIFIKKTNNFKNSNRQNLNIIIYFNKIKV